MDSKVTHTLLFLAIILQVLAAPAEKYGPPSPAIQQVFRNLGTQRQKPILYKPSINAPFLAVPHGKPSISSSDGKVFLESSESTEEELEPQTPAWMNSAPQVSYFVDQPFSNAPDISGIKFVNNFAPAQQQSTNPMSFLRNGGTPAWLLQLRNLLDVVNRKDVLLNSDRFVKTAEPYDISSESYSQQKQRKSYTSGHDIVKEIPASPSPDYYYDSRQSASASSSSKFDSSRQTGFSQSQSSNTNNLRLPVKQIHDLVQVVPYQSTPFSPYYGPESVVVDNALNSLPPFGSSALFGNNYQSASHYQVPSNQQVFSVVSSYPYQNQIPVNVIPTTSFHGVARDQTVNSVNVNPYQNQIPINVVPSLPFTSSYPYRNQIPLHVVTSAPFNGFIRDQTVNSARTGSSSKSSINNFQTQLNVHHVNDIIPIKENKNSNSKANIVSSVNHNSSQNSSTTQVTLYPLLNSHPGAVTNFAYPKINPDSSKSRTPVFVLASKSNNGINKITAPEVGKPVLTPPLFAHSVTSTNLQTNANVNVKPPAFVTYVQQLPGSHNYNSPGSSVQSFGLPASVVLRPNYQTYSSAVGSNHQSSGSYAYSSSNSNSKLLQPQQQYIYVQQPTNSNRQSSISQSVRINSNVPVVTQTSLPLPSGSYVYTSGGSSQTNLAPSLPLPASQIKYVQNSRINSVPTNTQIFGSFNSNINRNKTVILDQVLPPSKSHVFTSSVTNSNSGQSASDGHVTTYTDNHSGTEAFIQNRLPGTQTAIFSNTKVVANGVASNTPPPIFNFGYEYDCETNEGSVGTSNKGSYPYPPAVPVGVIPSGRV